MSIASWHRAGLALAVALCAPIPALPAAAAPVRVILDTDMSTDIDDAMALAMLHSLADRGEAQLLAVTVSTQDPWSARLVDLIDTFYGRPAIAIGLVRGGRTREAQLGPGVNTAYLARDIAEMKRPDGAPLYPQSFPQDRPMPDAVAVLRHALAAQPDGSVVMIQIGFSTNLAHLLASGPDAASPLDGSALVRRKTRLLAAMGGYFGPPAPGAKEYNIFNDVGSAQSVFGRWPTPIVTSGNELGGAMLFPAARVASGFAYAAHHPIADLYRDFRYAFLGEQGPVSVAWPHDHSMYDLTAVLYAVRPDQDYFGLSKPGRILIHDDGSNSFAETEDGPHRYLTATGTQSARAIEAMIELTTEPPAGGPAG